MLQVGKEGPQKVECGPRPGLFSHGGRGCPESQIPRPRSLNLFPKRLARPQFSAAPGEASRGGTDSRQR